MATTVAAAPSLLSDKIISAVVGDLPILNSISTVLSPTLGQRGKTVQVSLMGAGTASEFDKSSNTYATVDGSTLTSASVTLKHFKYTDEFDPLTVQEYGEQYLINAFAPTAALALSKKCWAEIGSIITNANFSTKTTVAVADFGVDDVIASQKQLDDAKAAKPRAIVLGNGYVASLRNDSKIVSSLNPLANNTLITGGFPQLFGAQVYQWNDIPGNSENLAGFSCGADAIAVASGLPLAMIPGANVSSSVDASGLAVQVMVGQSESGMLRVTATLLFGAAKGRATSLTRLVTA